MTPIPARRVRRLLLALPLFLTACGHSAPTTLHALSATPPARTFGEYAGLPVRVDAVRLPPEIDRIEMLRETGAGRYVVLEFDRWAALPRQLARQALAKDLSDRLPAGAVTVAASADGPPVTAVAVDILSFSAGPGIASLAADWTRGCRPGAALRRRHARLEAPGGSDAPAALSTLLGQLADQIAADLAATPDLGCPAVR